MIDRNEIHMFKIAAEAILSTEKKRWPCMKKIHETANQNNANHIFYNYAKPYGEQLKAYETTLETSNNINEIKKIFNELSLLKSYCDAHIFIDRIETEQMMNKKGVTNEIT